MPDEIFIKTILQKGKEAKDKVSFAFAGISSEQLFGSLRPEAGALHNAWITWSYQVAVISLTWKK